MALILNLETATTVCSVALAKEGKVIAFKEVNSGYTHAENLTMFIQDVLAASQFKLSDIDAVAVSKGPGSYTGLRIGVSTAKGLCFSLEKPLIGVNTLKAMYTGMLQTLNTQYSILNTLFCPMIDARRMEVYCSVYDSLGNELEATSAQIITDGSFSELLKKNKIIFFGDGAEKCKPALSHQANASFIDKAVLSAKNMALLSEQAFLNKKFEDVAYFEPFYLKDFVGNKKA